MPRFVFALPWWVAFPLFMLWIASILTLVALGLVWVAVATVWEAISNG